MSETRTITRRRLLAGVAGTAVLLAAGPLAHADANAFGELLERYVVAAPDGINRVDYAARKASPGDRQALVAFIDAEARRDPAAMAPAERFAYWANLYNALTLAVVIEAYPVGSIRDIKSKGRPFSFKAGPWQTRLVTVAGRQMSLDDIEHKTLRAEFGDPRVHYAVNCASLGCPNLPVRPWQAATLEVDLDAAAGAYVNHPRGVAVVGPGRLKASSLYKWYREDFGGSDAGVVQHLRRYAAPPLTGALDGSVRIADHGYDWSLNDASGAS